MKSFIKSHQRGSSAALYHEPPNLDLTNQQTRSSLDLPSDATSSSILSDFPVSPLKKIPTSPTKSTKFQRFFQRGKNSNSGTNLIDLVNVSPKKSQPPSIIGTRTHEWGISSNEVSQHRLSWNTKSSQSPTSFSPNISNPESNTARNTDNIDEDLLRLPVNTILEIPDSKSIKDRKGIHRKAQIFTKDRIHESTGTLSIDINSYPNYEPDIFFTPEIKSGEKFEETQINLKDFNGDGSLIKLGDAISFDKNNAEVKEKEVEDDDKDDDGDDILSLDGSEFSFEQDPKAGRSASIRYYKSLVEDEIDDINGQVKEQGFYVNDYYDDEDFDEDMNYFDDDEFNDDEEIFNKKYFSDDDDIIEEKPKSILQGSESSKSLKDLGTQHMNQSIRNVDKVDCALNHRPQLAPRRSLKYHQLSKDLDQELSYDKYSWMSDDLNNATVADDTTSQQEDSYELYLDEINDVPEDYEFESDQERNVEQKSLRSRSLNSNSKTNHGMIIDHVTSAQNRIQTTDKTVTLFNTNLTTFKEKNEAKETNLSSSSTGFIPSTPNPTFLNASNFELSPISEGSFDGSP
ncbi:hypothetical protein WICMUC_001957 [Wickerhamomyces mucosus]|uniref:Transcription factor Iwr1 domain-containing protein n=1 Tax=Wickerhamomyces mucosus TaxID=1378264 RepID=A0A9P8PRR2_9ASCO|nr:hypothetical protein WICMUC_001957 [Wickerhamomyces mucosus]